MSAITQQPSWFPPSPCDSLNELLDKAHPIFVTNSLTRSKVRFVPRNGRQVYIYSCGPTVYDSSHMGHARTYLSFDIIQRILKDYFNYDVVSIMNVTDIDDKIIKRSIERNVPFRELARKYENEYFEDMASLGIRKPDVLTRVTEYLPKLIEMIEKIKSNGYAYESNGSVYFDVQKYSKDHSYAKLLPENIGSEKESESVGLNDKKCDYDFALWKSCQKCDNCWESPWGYGRPGWHIECSAMSVDSLLLFSDGIMDIHCGGVDLRFPHHDNEMAQSEAYLNQKQSINYFLHTGHLNIEGLKMSKSLKNFITIRQALEINSPRQIRLCFLYHKWNATINYSDGALESAAAKDKFFSEFFNNMKPFLRIDHSNDVISFDEKTKNLFQIFNKTKLDVHNSFCDDFDTKSAMESLENLIKSTNIYMEQSEPRYTIICTISQYITRIFTVLGLIENNDIGFKISNSDSEISVTPYLDVLSQFRDQVRHFSKGKYPELLTLCDQLRDDVLPNYGVKLEDKEGQSIWKLVDKETLLKEKQEKLLEKQRIEEKKAATLKKQEEERIARLQKGSLSPLEMFRNPDLYSTYDDTGLPVLDKEGNPVAKSQLKKLKKLQQTQAKLHSEYLESIKDPK